MKAAFIESNGEPSVIRIRELPRPVPKDGEVLVRLKFASLNHLDLWIRKGIPGHKLPFPHVLGADGSGVVEEMGKGVFSFKVGDEVIVNPAVSCMKCEACLTGLEKLCAEYKLLGEDIWGTNAEFVVVPTSSLFLKPKELTFEEAAAFPLVTVTAWEMLMNKAQLKAGQSVLIHAAGSGVSQMAIQIAKLHGAVVVVTSGSDEKLKLAQDLGATHLINYKTTDFSKEVRKSFPKGVDIVFDHVGKDFWEKNIKVTKSGGVLVTCGATTGHEAITDLRHLFFRQLRLLGSTMGNKRDFPKLVELMRTKKLRVPLAAIFSLSELQKAHEFLQSGAQTGKVLIRISAT